MQRYTFARNTGTIVAASVAGPGQKPRQVVVKVKNNTVVAVEQVKPKAPVTAESGWDLIQVPDEQLLIPAFIDCHVHLVLDGINGFNGFNGPAPYHLIQSRLENMLHAGIVAVRDGSDRYNSAWAYQSYAKRNNQSPLPYIVTTGQAIFRQGHYGMKLGEYGITNVSQAETIIRRLKKMGTNQVKVVLSGLVSLNNPGSVGPVQFNEQEMAFIVSTARKHGLPVMVHASSDRAIQVAVGAGAHTIEHGYYVTDESLKRMADKRVAWVPTVAPMAALAERFAAGGEGKKADIARQAVEQQLSMMARAHAYGVTLGVGTDAGSPGVSWDKGYYEELMFFEKAGLPPHAILESATKNGASLLGLSHELGTIEVGKQPCWLAVKPDFLAFKNPKLYPQALFCPEGSLK